MTNTIQLYLKTKLQNVVCYTLYVCVCVSVYILYLFLSPFSSSLSFIAFSSHQQPLLILSSIILSHLDEYTIFGIFVCMDAFFFSPSRAQIFSIWFSGFPSTNNVQKTGNASWPHKLLLLVQEKRHPSQKSQNETKQATKMKEVKNEWARNKCYEFVSVFDWKMLFNSMMPAVCIHSRCLSLFYVYQCDAFLHIPHILRSRFSFFAFILFAVHNIVTLSFGVNWSGNWRQKGMENDSFFGLFVKIARKKNFCSAHELKIRCQWFFSSIVDCFSIILILK